MTTTNITRKHRLLFICLGNICRSPAAEGVMKAKVHAANLDEQFFIDSAGIGNWHAGQLPDSRMRERGARRGYRLDSRARQIRQTDFDDFDLLLVMDHENYGDLSDFDYALDLIEDACDGLLEQLLH